MKLPLYWIDAFTDRPFHGNPAAVVPLDAWLPDALMQRIAFENGLAETAFFVRSATDRYHLRWFTPTIEVDLCGHATLAAAFVLFALMKHAENVVSFDSRSGLLRVTRQGELIELDFPSRPPTPDAGSDELVQALGAVPVAVATARDTLCVFTDETEIKALRPDFSALARLDTFAVIATAPGRECDFVSRFFAPRAGVDEDPVTGSAHCTLVPYWAERLGKTRLHARQLSRRGGDLFCALRGERVHIGGHAVLYLRGELEL